MLLGFIVTLIYWILYILEILIFIRCILSFLPFDNGFTRWVYAATEPILAPCRKLTGEMMSSLPVDFSPVIVLLILQFLQRIMLSVF